MPLLAPGITQLAAATSSNAFLVEADDGLTLVDAGTTKGVELLLKAIVDLGHSLTDVKRVVLTHAHPDHVQAAPEIRELTGARLLAHPADAGWLRAGRVPASGRSGVGARNFDQLPVAHWTPFDVDQALGDGDAVGGLRVVHTPGHSPGHIALFHPGSKVLLVGDAVFHQRKLSLGPAGFAADPAARGAGLAQLPRDLTAIGFGHGAPLADPSPFLSFLASPA